MKKTVVMLSLALSCFAPAVANAICGEISFEEGRFYINMGNASANLVAHDTVFFKPRRDLMNVVGTQACVEGDWVNDYVFNVLRVN